MASNSFLIFCSGLTFAVGGINLYIGIRNLKDRSYLYFGLLSIFASTFLLNQIPSRIISISGDIRNLISIFLAVVFYTLFIWFLGEFTGYRRKTWQVTISVMAVTVFLLYFLLSNSLISLVLWESLAHLTILFICIYGLYAGIKGLKNLNNLWRLTYFILIGLLLTLTILVWAQIVFRINILYVWGEMMTPLDLFPVFFSLIIGPKLSHDVIRSYQLDKEIFAKEKRWSSLMEKIDLLVLELDLEGRIVYINSFFNTFTGYSTSEVKGSDWFDLMIDPSEQEEIKSIYSEFLTKEEIPAYQNHIRLKNGTLKNIQWSNLQLRDVDDNIVGCLSLGVDVTERELALTRIEQLKNQLEKENLLLRKEIKEYDIQTDIIGESDSIKYAIKRSIRVSETDSTVLLEGETGVGKELFADLIQSRSRRYHQPFIKVNCSAIPRELIESEFFGHEKGAFTGALKNRQGRFELANKGTIFLDELGEIPLELQAKLLRVLQSGEFEPVGSEVTKKVDVRVIAATNRDLNNESREGTFRQDLFYRLNVYPITIPPLKHRKEDIPILVKHFADKIGKRMGKKMKDISKADLSLLEQYDWPGNVRELENIIERAIINSTGNTLKIDESQFRRKRYPDQDFDEGKNTSTLTDSQRSHILKVLEACNWKINGRHGAAQKLGLPPSTLRSKMKKLKIERPVDPDNE